MPVEDWVAFVGDGSTSTKHRGIDLKGGLRAGCKFGVVLEWTDGLTFGGDGERGDQEVLVDLVADFGGEETEVGRV